MKGEMPAGVAMRYGDDVAIGGVQRHGRIGNRFAQRVSEGSGHFTDGRRVA